MDTDSGDSENATLLRLSSWNHVKLLMTLSLVTPRGEQSVATSSGDDDRAVWPKIGIPRHAAAPAQLIVSEHCISMAV